MAKLSGKDGTVKYGATPTELEVTDWSYDKSMEVKEVTDSGSGDGKEYLPDGRYSITGSFSAFVEMSVTPPTFGTEVALQLHYDATNYDGFNAIITNESPALQVTGGDAVKKTFSFTATGAITETRV